MRRFVLLFFLMILSLSSVRARAEVLASVGANMVFELSPDGRRYEARTPVSLRGGYRFEIADAFAEYTNFRTAGGTPLLYVQREHQEFLIWGRKIFMKNWTVSPYLGAGVGFEYDRVTTTFGPERSEAAGDPLGMLAAAAGARFALIENLELLLEGRMSVAPDYQPNPLFGGGFVLGLKF